MHPADAIHAAAAASRSRACVGLDPRPALIPPALREAALTRHGDTREAVAEAFWLFNQGVIDATSAHCAAYKPQLACYEAYGAAGMRCLEQTVRHAHERGVPVILDGKRNDLGSTAEHYAQGYLYQAPGLGSAQLPGTQAAWLTVNAYLGVDGVTPFRSTPPRAGVFVLVKTSNPSSGDLQDQRMQGSDSLTVAEQMALLVARWGEGRLGACGLSDVGAVVGATYPAHAKRLRSLMPQTLFLVPGYGAQGASAADALAGARSDGSGVVVNSSRAIIGAWQQSPEAAVRWQEAARAALETMNRDLGHPSAG
jgi:orotidine-5'-phosphate decarboxylase